MICDTAHKYSERVTHRSYIFVRLSNVCVDRAHIDGGEICRHTTDVGLRWYCGAEVHKRLMTLLCIAAIESM